MLTGFGRGLEVDTHFGDIASRVGEGFVIAGVSNVIISRRGKNDGNFGSGLAGERESLGNHGSDTNRLLHWSGNESPRSSEDAISRHGISPLGATRHRNLPT